MSEQVCTGYRLRNLDLGTHRWSCYYAPASGALVAGYFVDDTNDLCDNTTAFVQVGDIPPKGTCNAQVPVDNPCGVDGGAGAFTLAYAATPTLSAHVGGVGRSGVTGTISTFACARAGVMRSAAGATGPWPVSCAVTVVNGLQLTCTSPVIPLRY